MVQQGDAALAADTEALVLGSQRQLVPKRLAESEALERQREHVKQLKERKMHLFQEVQATAQDSAKKWQQSLELGSSRLETQRLLLELDQQHIRAMQEEEQRQLKLHRPDLLAN